MKLSLLILAIFLISSVSAGITITPATLEATTQINEQKDYQITIINNFDFDIFDLSFGDLTSKGFTFPDMTIEKNSTKSFTILFKPTISIHENLQVPVSFKYFVDLPLETATHQINISDPAGFTPNYLPIKQGDSVKFNNKHGNNFDVVIEGNSYNIPNGSSITHQFNNLGLKTYYDSYFGFSGSVEVLNKSSKEKAQNPNYNINWAVNINAISNPTTLTVDNSKNSYEVEYGKFKKGLLTIKNTGTEKAELVKLTSTDWITFNKNNINLEINDEEWVEYTITPIVFDTNETAKNYSISISTKGSNTNEINTTLSVFVPYKIVSTTFGEDSLDDRAWLDNVFCPKYPQSFLCNASSESYQNGSTIYTDSDIPINVSKRVIYDLQKDVKTTMDSNERTNNEMKILMDMLRTEFPEFRSIINNSLTIQEQNEKKTATAIRSWVIIFFFLFIYFLLYIVFKKWNKKSHKENLMNGGLNYTSK